MIKKLYWQHVEDVQILRDALKKNEVVISSTDTIYGFLGDITRESWNKINTLKEVDYKRPFLILIYSLSNLTYFVDASEIPEKTIRFISFCWPGPVTFIFKGKKDLPSFLTSNKGTIALRCPDHEGFKRLLHDFAGLFSTSANKSTRPAPHLFEQIADDLLDQVRYVMTDKKETKTEKASTLIDLSDSDYTKPFPFTIIREGAYCKDTLMQIYERS